MLRLATADLPWAVVDDFELHQHSPSYSYQTAEAMAKLFPEARLFWIMGSDQWNALPRWKCSERLAATVEFIVLARGETPQPREGSRLHIIVGGHPASATFIRDALASGDIRHPWLDPKVADWLAAHTLYRP
jgi:nicotinate-nucleotide adenylyltransferase